MAAKEEIDLSPPSPLPCHEALDSNSRFCCGGREGQTDTFIVPLPFIFKPLETEKWHPFSAEVRPDFITFSLGNKIGMIRGPLATGGANKIVLTPGASLRNLRLLMLP